jgi:flavin reductase ActVB
MAVTQDEFRAALSRFPSGVTVVTTKDAAGRFHGITVSAFCSVSLEPPLILVCIEKTTGSHYAFEESRVFVVNILSETQSDLSEHFASQMTYKFDDIEFHQGIDDLPILKDVAVSLECRLRSAHDAGDHTIFIGEVENVRVSDIAPLLYFHGNYRAVSD